MGNVHMEARQVNYRGGNKPMSVEEAIKNAGSEITPEEKTWIDSIPTLTASNAGKTDHAVIAPEFDAEAGTYEIGDQVMYEGKLYEFTSAHETPGDWDVTEVTEKTVADEIDSVKSGLINRTEYVAIDKRTLTYSDDEVKSSLLAMSSDRYHIGISFNMRFNGEDASGFGTREANSYGFWLVIDRYRARLFLYASGNWTVKTLSAS